ncbi:hypothetical protein CIHG_02096 [Coccidioides immitis H538.4]|uniref:Uncharacterized protein n=1 Tax=Coccidioides immitis H538.4 TaxID=396776 RepID=A0A0J8RK49_COCIT|nr:hypothetical protein CIHG_02096 [Coccidioides immitis H538.4]
MSIYSQGAPVCKALLVDQESMLVLSCPRIDRSANIRHNRQIQRERAKTDFENRRDSRCLAVVQKVCAGWPADRENVTGTVWGSRSPMITSRPAADQLNAVPRFSSAHTRPT